MMEMTAGQESGKKGEQESVDHQYTINLGAALIVGRNLQVPRNEYLHAHQPDSQCIRMRTNE